MGPQWWMMGLMTAPICFLAINLVLGVFYSNSDPVQAQLARINTRLGEMQTTLVNQISGVSSQTKQVLDEAIKMHSDVQTIAGTLGFVKNQQGAWVAPGSSAYDKLLAILNVLGAEWDDTNKKWKVPEKTLLAMLNRVEGAMAPRIVEPEKKVG
jgi:hypothetical protein